jgi:predicted RNA-binding protein YlqC (UPF0109 family)
MTDLLNFLLKGILGEEKFDVKESEENGRTIYTINTDPKNAGLIIGKGGRIIKSIRNLLKVRATLEKRAVAVNLGE